MKQLKILVADADDNFRSSLIEYLKANHDAIIIGEASCTAELNTLAFSNDPDLILIDTKLPGSEITIQVKSMLWQRSSLTFIAMEGHPPRLCLFSLVFAGFKGCVQKARIYDQIGHAIRNIGCKKPYFYKNIPMDPDSKQ
ncbi:MAG: hypothetical protein QM786_05680 [Breznakibacter sp.]